MSALQAQAGDARYRNMVSSVRLVRSDKARALEMQLQGKTMAEIANVLGVRLEAVERSLFWDRYPS